MPGGLILIRLHKVGVNINWFLTGEGRLVLAHNTNNVSEPVQHYLSRLEEDLLEDEEERFNELLKFSEAIKELDISPSLQRALLLVFVRHMADNSE